MSLPATAVAKPGSAPVCPSGRAGRRAAACLALLLLAAGCAHPAGQRPGSSAWRAGPLLEGGRRDDGATVTAVRPLFSRAVSSNETDAVTDVLWPVGTFRRRESRLGWRLFPAFGADADIDDPESAFTFRIFPIFFEGRSRAGEPYAAIVPLGGTICDLPGVDRMRFFLLPLYIDSQTRDTRTQSVLWPLFQRRHGDETDQWHLLPFYGESRRSREELTVEHRFILWPFWNDVRYTGERVHGSGFVLFPIFGHTELSTEETWMVLPPFFSFTRAGDDYRLLRCPWPLVKIEDRGDDHTRNFWPFYARRETPRRTRWSLLWPFFTGEEVRYGDRDVTRLAAVPIYYHERRTPAGQPPELVHRRVWPLFSLDRRDGRSRLRVPELSFMARHPSIERNLAPLWSFYVREGRLPEGDTRHTLFWGLANWGRMSGDRYFNVFGWLGSEPASPEGAPQP